jgi:hypothetical protein
MCSLLGETPQRAETGRARAADRRGSARSVLPDADDVELAFGTKARLLKAVIDTAIAGDVQPVPMLAREWAAQAEATAGPAEFVAVVARQLTESAQRAAGLTLVALEAARAGFAPFYPLTRHHRRRRARKRLSSMGHRPPKSVVNGPSTTLGTGAVSRRESRKPEPVWHPTSTLSTTYLPYPVHQASDDADQRITCSWPVAGVGHPRIR